MGADNTFGEENFESIEERLNSLRHMEYDIDVQKEIIRLERIKEQANCDGRWINDCPYPQCQCAKNYNLEIWRADKNNQKPTGWSKPVTEDDIISLTELNIISDGVKKMLDDAVAQREAMFQSMGVPKEITAIEKEEFYAKYDEDYSADQDRLEMLSGCRKSVHMILIFTAIVAIIITVLLLK
jgi:hypothetical protein